MEKRSTLQSDPPAESLDELRVGGLKNDRSEAHHDHRKSGDQRWVQELESRVDVLESALFDHATILRDRVADRLNRLEATLNANQELLEKALGSREGSSVEIDERDVVVVKSTEGEREGELDDFYTVGPEELVTSARPATANTLNDLVDALTATRSHLDTIAVALQHTRSELSQ